MKRALILLALAAMFLLHAQEQPPSAVPAPHATGTERTGEAEHESLPNEIWWKWANFIILAAALGYLIKKYAGPFYISQTEEIQNGIREAAAVKAEAEARAAEIERRVATLQVEVEALRAGSKSEIESEGARMRQDTAAEIAKIQGRAEQEIASAAKNAIQDLRTYSAGLALSLAEQQLRGSLTPTTQDALVDSFVKDLRTKAAQV